MEKLRTLNTTLTVFFKDNKVLLGEKKRGFAKGTLNGIGGKQDMGETIEQAMVRECQEEIGYLNPYEECDCYGITNGLAIVCYKIDGSLVGEKKVGFVKWLDGVK